MKSTVYHYYGPKRKGRCCGQFTIKSWAISSAIYSLVSPAAAVKSVCLWPCKHGQKNFLWRQLTVKNGFTCSPSLSACADRLEHGTGCDCARSPWGGPFDIHTSLLNYLSFLSQNISILVVLMYSWQISVNMKKYQSLGDVYYGKAAGSTRIP